MIFIIKLIHFLLNYFQFFQKYRNVWLADVDLPFYVVISWHSVCRFKLQLYAVDTFRLRALDVDEFIDGQHSASKMFLQRCRVFFEYLAEGLRVLARKSELLQLHRENVLSDVEAHGGQEKKPHARERRLVIIDGTERLWFRVIDGVAWQNRFHHVRSEKPQFNAAQPTEIWVDAGQDVIGAVAVATEFEPLPERK